MATVRLGLSQLNMPLVVTAHELRLVYVATPKVASTTLLATLLDLAGYAGNRTNPQRVFYDHRHAAQLRTCGLEARQCNRRELADYARDRVGHRWIAAKRDPTQRLISNYFNKLNRYAKRVKFHAYLKGKLSQFCRGRKAWTDPHEANSCIRDLISTDEFVAGIQQIGPEFDVHFQPQVDQICPDLVDYDLILRLENMEHDFWQLMEMLGIAADSVPNLPRRNPSARGSSHTLLSMRSLEITSQMYRRDYELLGYPPPI